MDRPLRPVWPLLETAFCEESNGLRAKRPSLPGAALLAPRLSRHPERGVKRWDVAAGSLLCERAGLVVEPLAEAPPQGSGILVAAPALADELRRLIGRTTG